MCVASQRNAASLSVMLTVALWFSAFPCQAQTASASTAGAKTQTSVLKQPFKYPASEVVLSDLIVALTTQCHVSVAMDGMPVREKAELKIEGTLKDALDQIGEAFDYSWRVNNKGVILMTKRFKDPMTRPQASRLELREAARQILDALRLVPYDPNPQRWSQAVVELGQTFTPEQIAALKSGEQISAASLSGPQIALLTQAIYGNAFGDQLAIWERFNGRLHEMATAKLTFKPRSIGGGSAFDVYLVRHDSKGVVLPDFLGVLNAKQ